MRLLRRGIGTISIAFVAVAIVIVAAAGVLDIASQQNVHTSPNILAGPTNWNQINPATHLKFSIALNSSTVRQGGVLAVSFNLFNTLDNVNNVTAANNFQLTNASEDSGHAGIGWNCAQDDVFRVEVLSGYYGLNNYSKGTPLDVLVWFPPYAFNECPYYIRPANDTAEAFTLLYQGQNNYAFSSRSNVAQWTTAQDWNVRCGPTNPANVTITTTITYSCPQIGQKAVMNETMILKTANFANSIGAYTIVGGDEWGDLLVAHVAIE